MQPEPRAGNLPTIMTDLYTAPAGGAVIEYITAANITAADVVVNFEIVIAGTGAGTAKQPFNKTVTPDDNVISVTPGKVYLKEGDKIRGMASAADSASYFISALGGFFS